MATGNMDSTAAVVEQGDSQPPCFLKAMSSTAPHLVARCMKSVGSTCRKNAISGTRLAQVSWLTTRSQRRPHLGAPTVGLNHSLANRQGPSCPPKIRRHIRTSAPRRMWAVYRGIWIYSRSSCNRTQTKPAAHWTEQKFTSTPSCFFAAQQTGRTGRSQLAGRHAPVHGHQHTAFGGHTQRICRPHEPAMEERLALPQTTHIQT